VTQFLHPSPGILRVFVACLLSFTILITPIAAVAAPSIAKASTVKDNDGKKRDQAKSAEEELFVNPPTAMPAPALPGPLPEPAPEPVPPPVGSVTAVLSVLPLGTVNPGATLTYKVDVGNTTGSDATGLVFADSIDPHTTFVPGSIQSTPVAFDHATVSTNEDTAVVITLQGQDPDGTNLASFSIVTPPAPAKGTLGSISAPTCVGGVCSATVTYTPQPNVNGADSFTFKVNDGTSDSKVGEEGIVPITVIAVNDPPTFTAGTNQIVNEDAGAQAVSGFVTAISPGPGNESGQTVSFIIDSPSNALFATQPSIDSTGKLTYNSAPNLHGVATITYHAQDNGGIVGCTDPNCNITSPPNSFTITVNKVNDPPTAQAQSYPAQANMQISVAAGSGLLVGAADAADVAGNGSYIPTFTVGSVNGVTPVAGVINATVAGVGTFAVNASTGAFTVDPAPGVTGTVSTNYTVCDNGDGTVPAASMCSATATLSLVIAGPVIWFVNPGAGPDTTHTGTLSNPFQLLASANTAMGLNAGQRIFVYTGTTTSGVGVTLTTSQWLIGQGATNSGNTTNFDTFMGISPPANTIARPAVNGTKPTIAGRVQMNASNTRVQGVAIAPPANTQGLTATNGVAMTGMQVGVSATQSDVTVSTTGLSGTNAMGVSLNNAGGVFSLISVNVNGGAKGISVTNLATGSFTVLGTGSAGTGGTIQNATNRGAEFISSSNITLKYMNINGNGLSSPSSAPCSDLSNVIIGAASNTSSNCESNIHLQSVSTVVLDTVTANSSKQVGINGNAVNGLTLTDVTASLNGDAINEDGVQLVNSTGTITVTRGIFKDNAANAFRMQNGTGTPTLNITGNNTATGGFFGNTNYPQAGGSAPSPNNTTANSGIFLATANTNSAKITAVIKGVTIDRVYSHGLHADSAGNGTLDLTFGQAGAGNGNTVTNTGLGVVIVGTNSTGFTYSIVNNTFNNTAAAIPLGFATNVISARKAGAGTWTGTISGNKIGTNTVARSGCDVSACNGITADAFNSSGTYTATITNNEVNEVNGAGIDVQSGGGSDSTVIKTTITGNTVRDPFIGAGSGSQNTAIFVQSGSVVGDTTTVKAQIDSNICSGSWNTPGNHSLIRVRERFTTTTFCLTNYNPANDYDGGGAGNVGDVATFLAQQNSGSTAPAGYAIGSASQIATAPAAGSVSGPSCPLLLAQGGIMAALNSPSLISAFLSSSFESPVFKSGPASISGGPKGIISNSITQPGLNEIVAAAIERWSVTGLTAQQIATLHKLTFDVANLGSSYLGEADDNHVLVDREAQGKGWFIDSTPQDDSEFSKASGTRRYTDPMSAPAGHVDLLTAIMHEMGHKLGLNDSYQEKDRDNLMYGYLTVGERRIPSQGQAANATPGQYVGAHFLSLPPSVESPAVTARARLNSAVAGERAAVVETRASVKTQSIFTSVSASLSGAPIAKPDRGSSPHVTQGVEKEVRDQRSEIRGQRSDLRLNHVRRALKANDGATLSWTPTLAASLFAPMFFSGGTFPINGTGTGFRLPSGKTITITFQVTVNNPPALSGPAVPGCGSAKCVANHGNLSGSNVSGFDTNTVATDVNVADTTTTVTSSLNPSFFGQAVTFTAKVSSASGIPTGTVQFRDGPSGTGVALGSPVTLTPTGTCPTADPCSVATSAVISSLTTGPHTITADYVNADGNFDSGSGLVSQQVDPKKTSTTTVTSSSGTSNVGDLVTFTATVAGSPGGPPTGSVVFKDNGNTITCANVGGQALISGVATCDISTLAEGSHPITAEYGGDTGFNGSSGALSPNQVVSKKATTTVVTSSPNPSNINQNVTLTATVSSVFPGTPTGTVQFKEGASNIGAAQTLNGSGVATVITSFSTSGNHAPITGDYSGDAAFNISTGTLSGGQDVNTCSATAVVTNTIDYNPGIDPVVSGSLRAAIDSVCAGATITFDPALISGGPATILLVTKLTVSQDLTITGLGATNLTISGNSLNRVFEVTAGTVTISDVTIAGGKVVGAAGTGGGLALGANGGSVFGGGISNAGTLTLLNAIVSGNQVTGGIGEANATQGGLGGDASGGGIYNTGTLTLTTTTVNGSNTATGGKGGSSDTLGGNGGFGRGGGVYSTGTLTLTNSTIASNTAAAGAGGDGTGGGSPTPGSPGSSAGGGVYTNCPTFTATINGSTFNANHAVGPLAEGGGIDSEGGTLKINNSTISGNLSDGNGGGFLNCGTSTAVFTSVTITGNHGDAANAGTPLGGAGGGIYVLSAGVTLRNTIVAGNLDGATGNLADVNDDISGNFGNQVDPSSSYNLIGDFATNSGLADGGPNHNVVGNGGAGTIDITTVLNTTLADNGGPTKTHALVNGSPALEKGNAFSLLIDQRGFPRTVDFDSIAPVSPYDDTDIGAYERSSTAATITKAFGQTTIQPGGSSTVTLTLTNPNAFDLTSASFTDTLVNMSAVAGNVVSTCGGTPPNPLGSGDTALSFTGITILANSSCTVIFAVTSSNPGTNPNATSGVSATGVPTGAASNTANLTVSGAPTITKAFLPTAIQTGGTSIVTLTLTNSNASPLTNASFTDTLVANLSAVGGAGAVSGTCAGAGTNTLAPGATGTLSFSGLTIPGSGNCTVTFAVTSIVAGTYPNFTSGVTTDQTPIGSGSGTVNLTVFAPPTIAKAFNPTAIEPGGTSIVTLTLSNSNASALTNASFADTLVNMSAVGGTVTGTCGASPGSLNPNDTALTFTGGTIPGGGSCTVIFSVKSSTLGPNPNSTSGVTTAETPIAVTPSNTVSLTVLAPPTVLSITRADANPTSSDPVHFTVTFSRAVTGVDTTDFTTTTTGAITGTSATGVAGGPSAYTVTVATGTGDGTLRLNLADNDSILSADAATIPLGGSGVGNGSFSAGEVYTIDRLNPFVSSITRTNSSPTNAATVDFTVTFSEAVNGVDTTDFILITTGLGGAPAVTLVTPASGPSVTYTVTASTGNGNGTIKLKLVDNNSITDVTAKTLAASPGTVENDGTFTPTDLAAKYDIDRTQPGVTINQRGTPPDPQTPQADPVTGPTASTVINFTVVFSEPIVAGTFTNTDVAISGTALATVANVSQIAPNDGTTFNVAVEGMTQSGTVIVDIPAGHASDLAGNLNTVSTSTDKTVTFNKDDFTTFEVNSLLDTDDSSCAPIGTGNGCTLREAINAANADAGAETITFAPALTSGGPATISLLTALPNITTDMTIQGPGANLLTVERNSGAGTNFRIFTINTGTVIISGLTISKGVLASSGQGGGIFNNTGATLTINNCAISGNQVGSSGFGGGIYSAGTLTLNSSTINNNHVNTSGGEGGGIYDAGASMNINNSTISGNTTGTDSKGGGIYNANALPLVISNSTVTLNTTSTGALSAGGGIYLASANLTLKNTIVGGGNSSPVGPDISGTLQSDGFNLIQSTSGATINQNVGAGPNITGQDPLLNPLADNGGGTFTHSLQCTSPAIDKGKNFGLTTDQRGGTRPFDLADSVYPNAAGGDGSDIGAYETQTGGGCLPLAVPPNPQPSTNEDTPVVITLTGTYSQNFALTFSITQQPGHSTANLVPSAANCAFAIVSPNPQPFMTCTSTVSYTPSANFNGLDAFKFKASAGGLDSEEADVNITVNPVNDQPLALSQSVVTDEDTPLPITLAGSDVETPAGSLAFTVTVQPLHGTLSGTAPNVTYTPNLNYNGPDSFKFTVTDTGDGPSPPLTSAAATISITVNAVNDAPVLDNSGNMSLSAINEDVAAASNTGTLVSGVIASAGGTRITDVDAGAVQGLAVIAVDNTNGTWQFSIDNGTNWAPFGTPDSLNARLLAANATTRVRFLPNLNFNGTADPGLTFRAWDQTSGTNGNTADVSIVGGTTAFSIAIETASITVNPVNDQPTADAQSVATNEDTALPITLTGSDVETPSGSLIFNLTVQPLHGVLSGTGANRTYTPAANYNGPDSFKFSITDTGDGASPALTSAEASVSITVNAVNDAPSFTKGADQTANGPVPQTVPNWATNISAGPPDESGQTLTFLVSNNNNAIFSVQPSISPSGTLTFTPAYGFDGTATVTVKLQDNGGVALGGVDTSAPQTFTITVHALNNPPTLNALGNVIVNEDAPLQTVNLSGITAGPIYESSQNLTVTAASNNTAVIPNPTVTYSSPNPTGSISFTPVPNANGSAMITVTVKDDGGTANGGVDTFVRTFIVTVNAINDAPVNHVPGSQNAPLNGNLVFSAANSNLIFISDVDAGTDPLQVTLKATDGTLTLSGTSGLSFIAGDGTGDALMTFTGSLADINAALNGMSNLAFGSGVIEITTNDLGHNGAGGPLTDIDTIQVTVIDNLAPLLLTAAGSDRAIALDSVTLLRDPFSLLDDHNFSSDHRTRITLFALHAQLKPGENASAVTADADVSGTVIPLTVESVRTIPGFDWLTQVVVKFPDQFSTGGGGEVDARISIHLRGATSNQAVVTIVPVPGP
jgi:CSLREA domain-containing protein